MTEADMTEAEILDITALGAQGDGVAQGPHGPRHVPFALPGERVRTSADGLPELLSAPNPGRRAPPCRHFGTCGGCVAQHMGDAVYADWKRQIVVDAFAQRGLAPEVAPLVRVPPGSRRRAVLTAQVRGGSVTLGYHRRRSHEVLAIEECPVLAPAIVEALPGLGALAAAIGRPETRLTVLATPVGLDVAADTDTGRAGRIEARAAALLANLARRHRIARIAVNGEVVVELERPALAAGGVAVVAPPASFVQAVAEAEAAMIEAVLTGIGKARRAADLFAGVGTFTFALARRARVLACDGDAAALAALADGARRTGGLKPIETRVRDLFREPLSARELEPFDAVVLDPPRAGARAQAEALARAKVARIVYVSCSPGTLARDARLLVDGGHRLERVVPIDQFLYAAHVEAVAMFARG